MVLRRQESLYNITTGLAWLATLCRLRGLLHLFDANVIAHEFFCRLLSEIFDLNLTVLDRLAANFPAIDLGDETNRRSFQITSERGGDKVQKTLNTYAANNLFEKYGQLNIVVIGEKQVTYKKLVLPTAFTFDPTTDILDVADLIKTIESLPTDKLERLAEIVRSEINFDAKAAVTPPQGQIRVLFFPANPTDNSQMALSLQLRGLKEQLKSPVIRKSVDLLSAWSDDFRGFIDWLHHYQPRVLHLTGCGAEPNDFRLKAPNGTLASLPCEVIQNLFRHLRDKIRVVVLDRCLTGDQGKIIEEEINCVIRINEDAPSEAVITFISAFYRSIGQGAPVQRAFDDGRAAVVLDGQPGDLVRLVHRAEIDPDELVLVMPRLMEDEAMGKIRFVQIEMATDQCLWEEMRHDRALDVSPYHPISGRPWFSQTYDIMPKEFYPFGSHQLSNNHWPYEQKVAESRVADPILEFTILNTASHPVVMSRIGIRPENIWNVAKANPLAYKLESYNAYELQIDELIIAQDITLRLPSPVRLESQATYRIRVRLKNYGPAVEKNETVIRLLVVADNETFVSDEIYLGLMWQGDSMLLPE
jgi:hypothetical protein